jgi:hypothetical protein
MNSILTCDIIKVENKNSYKKNVKSIPSLATSYSISLPPDNGTFGRIFTSNGDGTTAWRDYGNYSYGRVIMNNNGTSGRNLGFTTSFKEVNPTLSTFTLSESSSDVINSQNGRLKYIGIDDKLFTVTVLLSLYINNGNSSTSPIFSLALCKNISSGIVVTGSSQINYLMPMGQIISRYNIVLSKNDELSVIVKINNNASIDNNIYGYSLSIGSL